MKTKILALMDHRAINPGLYAIVLLAFLCVQSARAQTTAFTYQGKLNESGVAAGGSFQMQFALFDSLGGAGQVGSTIADVPVVVTQGIFSVGLDFGSSALSGANRWLEIAVRRNSGESYSTLSPREQLNSSPYSVRTLSAASADIALDSQKLGGVAASQFVTMTNGGNTFIQNGIAQQPTANFNISGNGTAGSLTANGPASFAGVASPGSAPAGQGRVYFDSATNKLKVSESGGAFVNLVGATGVSGSGTTNTIPLWTAGTTLGNSLITQASGAIQLPNNVSLAVGAQGNQVTFGSPNGETGMTISGASGRADLRSNGTLKLVNGAGGIPSGTNGIAIDTSGNVGVGTETPTGKFVVNAGGSGGLVQFHTPNGESGMSIIGTNRADLRFDGTTLKLLAGAGTSSPCCGIFINTSGNVGMGISSPLTRLALSGGPQWTSDLWNGSLSLPLNSAIGFDANASGQRFGMGNNAGGLIFFRTTSPFGNTGSLASYDLELTNTGNLIQPLTNNGLVKALVALNSDGTIARCFNSATNSSTGGCGFSSSHPGAGAYTVNFGFQVDNRYLAVTAINSSGSGGCSAPYSSVNSLSGNSVGVATLCGVFTFDGPMMIIVY